MPLMTCPDCGKEISDAAIACPNCGLPRPMYEQQSRERLAAEGLAADDRRKQMQLCFAIAAFVVLISVGIIAKTIFAPWSSAVIALKARNLLGGGVGCAIAYGLYRYARYLQRTPP